MRKKTVTVLPRVFTFHYSQFHVFAVFFFFSHMTHTVWHKNKDTCIKFLSPKEVLRCVSALRKATEPPPVCEGSAPVRAPPPLNVPQMASADSEAAEKNPDMLKK